MHTTEILKVNNIVPSLSYFLLERDRELLLETMDSASDSRSLLLRLKRTKRFQNILSQQQSGICRLIQEGKYQG